MSAKSLLRSANPQALIGQAHLYEAGAVVWRSELQHLAERIDNIDGPETRMAHHTSRAMCCR